MCWTVEVVMLEGVKRRRVVSQFRSQRKVIGYNVSVMGTGPRVPRFETGCWQILFDVTEFYWPSTRLEFSCFVDTGVTANSHGGTLHICTSVISYRLKQLHSQNSKQRHCVRRNLWRHIEGCGRLKLRIIGNFGPQTIMGAKWEWLYIRAYNTAV